MLPTLLVKGKIKHPSGITDVPITYIKKIIQNKRNKIPETFDDRFFIIKSETGSGKSTLLPVALYNLGFDKNILCTQPRILTAISIAHDISKSEYFPNMEIGKNVGYKTGVVNHRVEKRTESLLYSSLGILEVQLSIFDDREIIDSYSIIIIDEAHERSVSSDVTLKKLKELFERNKKKKSFPFIILTSATIDPKKYMRYFGMKYYIEVIGKSFSIETIFLEKDCYNIIDESLRIVEEISETKNDGDVLIFMPGIREITMIAKKLEKKKLKNITILVINRDAIITRNRDYKLLLKVIPTRKIIISTDIAETGLTIDTLKYVIDSGWTKKPETYYPYMIEGIITQPCAVTRLTQRKGRVGRKFPGIYYALYTEKTYKSLPRQQNPDIITNGATDEFLNLFDEEFNINELDLLDYPSMFFIQEMYNLYRTLGLIDKNNKITNLGNFHKKSGYSPQISYFICKSYIDKYSIFQISTIVSLLLNTGIGNIWEEYDKLTNFINSEKKSLDTDYAGYMIARENILNKLIILNFTTRKNNEDIKNLKKNLIDSFKFTHKITNNETRHGLSIIIKTDKKELYTNKFIVIKKTNQNTNLNYYYIKPLWLF